VTGTDAQQGEADVRKDGTDELSSNSRQSKVDNHRTTTATSRFRQTLDHAIEHDLTAFLESFVDGLHSLLVRGVVEEIVDDMVQDHLTMRERAMLQDLMGSLRWIDKRKKM
jgi:hypothetical protein